VTVPDDDNQACRVKQRNWAPGVPVSRG